MTRSRSLLCALAGLLLSSAAGCDNYTYYTVHVGLDHNTPDRTFDGIAACNLFVRAGDGTVVEKKLNLKFFIDQDREWVDACQLGRVKPNTFGGMLNYSSARDSGSLQFVVNMYDRSQSNSNFPKPFVQGASRVVSVAAGAELGKSDADRIDVVATTCMPNLPAGCTVKDNDKCEPCGIPTESCVPDCAIDF